MRQKIKSFLVRHGLEKQAWQTMRTMRKTKQRLLWPLDQFLYYLVRALPDSYRIKIKQWSGLVKKMDYRREPIWIHVDSNKEYGARRHSAGKEPETISWIEHDMAQDEVLYDVGACVGAYSLVAAKYFKNKITVYAFEPGFQNFAQLVKNIALNHCGSSIVPLPVALAHQTEISMFHYRTLATGSASHTLSKAATKQSFQPVLIQPILAYRLDDLIHQFKLPAPHHIKIDVDGAEMLVLSGMAQTLAAGTIKSLLIETGNFEKRKEIEAFLQKKGLHLKKSYPKKGSEMCNCIFTRDDAAAA